MAWSVMMVAGLELHSTTSTPASSAASLLLAKNSWKERRPMRATASTDVSASAETHIVMKTVASVESTPKAVMPRATPCEKIWNGVAATPLLSAPVPAVLRSENIMAATTMASTPTNDSATIAP